MQYNPIPIFYYHSIAPEKDPSWYKSFLTFGLVYFEDLLKYLVKEKYRFITLDEYFALRSDPAARNKKLICLTFDDGYLDNYVYVYPLLKKYNAKGTIFVSPWYVQEDTKARPTLEDVWNGKIKEEELQSLGFLSWEEMRLMEQSGVMDIQSHTITHTKYYSSDKIRDFHNPRADYLYPIGNLYPDKLPYYITNPEFKNLIPYGTPFFEETSSIIGKRVFINENFERECVDALKDIRWASYNFQTCMEKINPIYQSYLQADKLITHRESDAEYQKRVIFEISESKKILEENLQKTINHVCWPHGDYNDFCHETALKAGFTASHIVLDVGEKNTFPDRFDRTGAGIFRQNRFLSLWKARYKLGSYRGSFPYSLIHKAYTRIMYGK